MKGIYKFSKLEPGRRQLVEMMLNMHFGQIEELRIKGGQPQFDPPPRIIRDIVFGKNNNPHPIFGLDDFVMKNQVVELFEYFDELGDGTIHSISVQNGLPVRMKLEKTYRD